MRLEMLYESQDWSWGKFAAGVAAPIAATGLALGFAGNLKDKKDAPKGLEKPPITSPAEVPKTDPVEPQDLAEPQNLEPQNHDFDMPSFRRRLQRFEGYHRTAYPVQQGEIAIGIGHTMRNPNLNNPTAPSRRAFNHVFGDEVDFDAVLAGRQSLTDEQIRRLADYDIARHIRRAADNFPDLSTYPTPVQHAIVDATYRGDIGPRTTALINAGRWAEAADEYINHNGYRTARARGLKGIITRMNDNRRAFLEYAKQADVQE